MSKEMPPVNPGNEFIPPYPMDVGHSYLSSSLDAQELITNSTTPVDQEFFNSVG